MRDTSVITTAVVAAATVNRNMQPLAVSSSENHARSKERPVSSRILLDPDCFPQMAWLDATDRVWC